MMNLKLVIGGRIRLFEAESFTITDEDGNAPPNHPPHSRKISAHGIVGEATGPWWIGKPPYEVSEYHVYENAYLMNSAGKTIEVVSEPIR